MQDTSAFIELIDSVKKAGACLLSRWPGSSLSARHLGVQTKSDGTLVTAADMESNQILVEALTRLFPGDALLSEEMTPDRAALTQAKRTWIIDPLDGTKSFVAGRDDFSVLVALVEHDSPIFGVMFFPARQQLIVARSGAAPECNGEKLAVSKTTALQPGRIYIRNFECRRPEVASPMMDSGLALLKVACGELDGAIIKMTTHRQWDIAAPSSVILGAGGKISDEIGAKISFKTDPLGFKYFIASNGHIHELLQGLI